MTRRWRKIKEFITTTFTDGLPGWIPATAMTASILAITWMSVYGDRDARETLRVFGTPLATWGGAMVTAWLGYRGWKAWRASPDMTLPHGDERPPTKSKKKEEGDE